MGSGFPGRKPNVSPPHSRIHRWSCSASSMSRPFAARTRYVCEFPAVWRARLLAGFYHHVSGTKWTQYIARLYCVLVPTLFHAAVIYHHEFIMEPPPFLLWYSRFRFIQHFTNLIVSLLTEDALAFRFCKIINLTDITVDSAPIFFKFEKKCLRLMILFCVVIFSSISLYHMVFPYDFNLLGYLHGLCIELCVKLNFMNKFIVVGVFRSRLQVLRERLARHGFRRARDCRLGTNVYCDMYSTILETFLNIGNLHKFLLVIDFSVDAACFICTSCSLLMVQADEPLLVYFVVIFGAGSTIAPLCILCYEMECAMEQVEAIREFAVMELIKDPSVRVRRAILELVELTAAAPARLPLCRALRVDARLMLAVLGFCTGRVLLILQTLRR